MRITEVRNRKGTEVGLSVALQWFCIFSSVGIFMACGIIHIQISENTIFQTLSEIINYVSFLYELYLDQGARWQVKFLRRK